MSDLNQVNIIGRLGRDPEMHYTASGSAIANLAVATSENWKDKQTGENQERTEWHRVKFFGRQAEIVGEYGAKGMQVHIQGKLTTNKWQDKDGNDRYTTEIVGQRFDMLGRRSDAASAAAKQEEQQQSFRRPAADKPAAAPAADGFDEDDIPF